MKCRQALVLVATMAVLGGTGTASAAQASVHPARGLAGRIAAARLAPETGAGAPVAGSAACAPRLGHFNRTQACWQDKGTFTIININNGHVVGKAKYKLHQSIQLHVIGRDFVEHISVTSVVLTGHAPRDLEMFLSVSCAKPCHATNHFPEGAPLKVGTKGTISFRDSVGVGKVDKSFSKYELSLVSPKVISADPARWDDIILHRCDDALKGQGAGCVFPGFGPTLTTMKELPAIAKNIRRIQNKGPGHYGRRGTGGRGHPLHRLVNAAQQRRNHDAVCSRSKRGPPPKGKSCDEYPFQSTHEGGTSLSAANRGWAWVPSGQQNSQGGKIKAFYYANRILDGDAFWVKV